MSRIKNIVIVGAGFAGLSCALNLVKKYSTKSGKNAKDVSITLVDKHDYHLFTPNLHEVATAEEEFTSISQLKKSIAIPLGEILAGRRINFIKGELLAVENLQKKVLVGKKSIEYDYLVLATGLMPNYLNISGAQTYGLPLGNLTNALRIRNAVEFAVQSRRTDVVKKNIRFVIAGGGGASVEFAGELKSLLDLIAWKNNYPREKLKITLLESSGQLLPGFSERAAKDAFLRLNELGVQVEVGKIISRVERHFVEFMSTERMEYDALIWSAGEKAPLIKFGNEPARTGKDKLKTNQNLLLKGSDNIFVLGDLGVVTDETGKESLISGVEYALAQAAYLAKILPKLMQNQQQRPFTFKASGYIINIGGKWSIASLGKKYWVGFWAYLLGQLVHLNYFRKITGWKKAIKYWWLDQELYGRNN